MSWTYGSLVRTLTRLTAPYSIIAVPTKHIPAPAASTRASMMWGTGTQTHLRHRYLSSALRPVDHPDNH